MNPVTLQSKVINEMYPLVIRLYHEFLLSQIIWHFNTTFSNLADRKYKDYVYRKMLVQEYLKK